MAVTLEKTVRHSVGMGQIVAARTGELSAILGSCIGLCLYHPRSKETALGHIVLPDSAGREGLPGKYADTAVPYMLSLFRKQGFPPSSLVVKLVGGAAMFGKPGPLQIGATNAEAVKRCLAAHGLEVCSEHLGGNKGRRMIANATTGEVWIEMIGQPTVII